MINAKKKQKKTKLRGPVVFVINEKKKKKRKNRGLFVFVINEKKKKLEGRSSL